MEVVKSKSNGMTGEYKPEDESEESDCEAGLELEENRTTQEELDEETAALQREAEMSVEDLKKLYSKIEQQSENGDNESQNEQAEVESSALPTILADLDEEDDDDTDDVDYKPVTLDGFKYKEPRIGDNYQVDPNNIPKFVSDCDSTTNSNELEENLWTPNPNIEVEKFLIEHRKKMKIRSVTNDKVSNRKTMPDSEEALHQLLQCNYKFVQTHKRIQARNKLTPKKRGFWTEDEMASFELGLTLIGKNFFKIQHQHLPNKTIKEIVQFYYKQWKKTNRADSYEAKTRNSKRKFNCTNYMDKLLDDIEHKRSKRNEKSKRPLTIDSDSSENNVEPQPKKPSEPIVMTLDLSSNGKWRLNSSTD